MSLCINPGCSKPENSDTIFCQTCGSELLLAGRYRVICTLRPDQTQKGGFGAIYKISHNGTDKILKVLTKDLPKAIELFQQEAQVLQHLNHPGIPKGYDDFIFWPKNSQTPIYCLVMEKIEGIDLEEYIQQRGNRPIDQKLALEWLWQLAKILDEVHSEKFFHRDIKPSNIILRNDGQLVLIDFGAARQVTATIMAGGKNTGIYTPGYAPPEQEKGHAVIQSDFFALGRTFVYLLTGKQPTDLAIYNPQNDELRWRVLIPQVSSHLGDFIDQLMERSAKKRPADTQTILQRLEEINRLLYPPKIPKTVPSPLPKPVKVVAPPPLPPTTRRGFLKFAGFIGVGGASVLAVALVREFFFNNKPISITKDLGNGITLEMVAIPGGTFLMGSPESEKERSSDESPQHQVTVEPFFMGKFTITQAQWQAVAALPKVKIDLNPNPSYFKGADRPVEQVSWYDAEEFCARLSRKTGKAYRLPSEAEWEYACRGGTTTPFHFGETITPEIANYDGSYAYGGGPKGKYRQETTSVGSFGVANAFGLYDMHGNVWEWCADNWHGNYQNAPADGNIWLSSDESRVLRGGSWVINPRNCRSAIRGRYDPGSMSDFNFGFRLVCSVG